MSSFSKTISTPLGALYGAITRARLKLYQKGALPVEETGVPVISVGNITTGGTGKTPLVEWIARVVAREGLLRVCILTRGYGRTNPNERVIVSDGKEILSNAREGGDEPFLLAEKLRGLAAVVSDADRVAAARWALKNLGSEVFILDDGFQHLRIKRNLDLVTIDATNPFGGGRLLPLGRLREPLKGLKRADCIIITRADQITEIDALKLEVDRLSGSGLPIILSRTRVRGLRPLSPSMLDEEIAIDSFLQPVAAFCAIGNPQAFFSQLSGAGRNLVYTKAFADHHKYSQADIAELINRAGERGAQALLTTEKDAVKLGSLRFNLPCYVVEIELKFD
ncbi:MAG: tetraacyldisaccharide 4'-kinase, partial [Pyrinomonadaceae bacterium]